jgi:hypothetical protein
MEKGRQFFLLLIMLVLFTLFGSCDKNNVDTSSLYVLTSADVTANATLEELQQGRTLYVNNCSNCHGLYSPDKYSPTQWKSILSSMAPNTSMSASEVQLVTKYVCRGKQ